LVDFLLGSPWPGLFIWAAIYISDYTMTLICARMYKAGVKEKLVFEGSYEITPYFQADIDSLKVISTRFLFALVLALVALGFVWWLTVQSEEPGLYHFLLGAMISIQLVVHMRHWRNFFLFRAMIANDDIRGHIEYPRALMLRLSCKEWLTFSALFFLLFAFTQSWFILGGVFGCLSLALKHWKLARKATPTSPAPQ